VAVINETMAQRSWPGQDPIGKRFRFYGDTGFREVVGVVATTKYNTIGEPPTPAIYYPFAQEPSDAMNLMVRTAGDPSAALGAAQGEIRSIDPMVPVTNPFTMRQLIDLSLWAPKMGAILLGILGALALTLAMVGLYGVMAYSVVQRQHEIGLRMALGAAQGDVLRLVLRQGLTLVGIGLLIGLALALAVARTTASLLYGSALDPVTFAAVAGVLAFVALIASTVPALRASRVDPLIALRA
jgi:putative ABC transport system permease protein